METDAVSASAQQAVDTAVTLVSNWGLQVMGAIALLIVGRIAAGMVSRGVRRSLERASVDRHLVPFFSSAANYLVLTVVLIAVLQLFGIHTTSLVAVVGAAGLAIGLALQGTLSSFASGVMLLIFRPFSVGDYVEVGGSAGSVEELGIFTTTLNTPDNVRIVIPNSAVYGEVIKNYSANENRRVDLVMGISYSDDIERALTIIHGVVTKDDRVLSDPELTVAVAELGDSSVNIVVRPWCKGTNYWPLRFDLMRALKEALEAGGCSIPFPQRDLHVVSLPADGRESMAL
ncbi:MAG: mechanosensitive ion channel [Deltaproteobacteria bacterium]|nr:mechanosensitive ion channel [Deltaproteobacteria bacterium]MBW2698436.1 mechanosensitive ion channel [Deltaproteobacteria bacterium]